MSNFQPLKAKLTPILLCVLSAGGTFALFASVPLLARIAPSGLSPATEPWQHPGNPFLNP